MLIKLYLVCFICIFNPVFCAILWNGNFNDYSSSADLDKWSFSNQGSWPYQTYIYGNKETSNNMSTFVTLSSDYRSLNDNSARQGARVEINSDSIWNGNTMLRTELIAAYDFGQSTGTKFLHFSLKQGSTNQLLATNEHQIVFFESHFCDIRFGGDFGNKLNFINSDGQSLWSADLGSDVWHNFAIEIDFAGRNVGLFHSIGANPLARVVQPSSSSVASSEWHIGNLRLPLNGVQDPTPEVLYYSSIYIADTLLVLSPVPGDTGSVTTGSSESSDNSGSSSEHKQKPKRKTSAGTIVAAILIPCIIFAIVVALYISAKNNRAKFDDSLVEGLLNKA